MRAIKWVVSKWWRIAGVIALLLTILALLPEKEDESEEDCEEPEEDEELYDGDSGVDTPCMGCGSVNDDGVCECPLRAKYGCSFCGEIPVSSLEESEELHPEDWC